MEAAVRHSGHLGAVGTVSDRLRRGARDRAIRPGAVCQGVGVAVEVRGDSDVCGHGKVRAARRQDPVAPVDEVVAAVRHGGHRSAVGTVSDRLRRGARDRTVGPGAVCQGAGADVGVGGKREVGRV